MNFLKWIGGGVLVVILLVFITLVYSQMVILTGRIDAQAQAFDTYIRVEQAKQSIMTELLAMCMEQDMTDLRIPGDGGVYCSRVEDGNTVVVPLEWNETVQ